MSKPFSPGFTITTRKKIIHPRKKPSFYYYSPLHIVDDIDQNSMFDVMIIVQLIERVDQVEFDQIVVEIHIEFGVALNENIETVVQITNLRKEITLIL